MSVVTTEPVLYITTSILLGALGVRFVTTVPTPHVRDAECARGHECLIRHHFNSPHKADFLKVLSSA